MSAMTLQELEFQLLSLSPADKVRAIKMLAQNLGDTWVGIKKTPDVCGGDACIKNTRIPVWVLVQARDLGVSEIELLQDYPILSADDLANAWAYATAHQEEIDQAIYENNRA
jgi:uncharacterized protein (DUF433 family)